MFTTWFIIIGVTLFISAFLVGSWMVSVVFFKEKKNTKDGYRAIIGPILLIFAGFSLGSTIDAKMEKKNMINCLNGNEDCPYKKVIKYESKDSISTDTLYYRN